MSDDILNRIDAALERNRLRFDPLGGEPWDADRVDRWGDGMRVRPARAGIEEVSGQGEAASELLPSVGVCHGCRMVLPLQTAKLCGPCGALPPCRAERWAAIWDATAVCFRPTGHGGSHESVEGRIWLDRVYADVPAAGSPVEALRPEDSPRLLARFWICPRCRTYGTRTARLKALHEADCDEPPVDADPDPDPAPTRNPLSDLYAALRARARRGGR